MAQRKQWKEETDCFCAVSESGTRYTVVKKTTFFRILTNSGWTQAMEGSSEYILNDGSHVSPLDGETFKIVKSDIIIRRAD